jgi:Domain of unknown function (DUF4157)
VQIHADARASASARSVGALAYSVGSHIVFGEGRYTPATPAGRMLLAHELAHVVQQSRGGGSGGGDPGALEAAANRAAETAARPYATVATVDGVSSIALLRQTKDPVVTGIGHVKAMTPEDMYNKLIAMRGFDEAIPVSKLDEVKNQLAQMEAELKSNPTPELQRTYNKLLSQYNISTFEGAGGPMGQGYNTYAIVQVVDHEGNIIAVADGKYTGGLHAEEIALNKINAQLGDQKIPGARVEVVGDRTVCSDVCVPAFERFADKHDIGEVEGHVFRRPKAVGSGLASEKYTARSATTKASEGRTPVKESRQIVSRTTSGPAPPASKSGGAGQVGAHEETGATPSGPVAGKGAAEGSPRVRVAGEGAAESTPRVGVAGEGAVESTPRVGVAGEGAAESTPRVGLAGEGPAESTPRVGVAGEAEKDTGVPRLGGALGAAGTGESVLGDVAKSTAKGAAFSIGTGLILFVLQDLSRDRVLADLAALPQPKADKRSARAYLSDEKTQNGVRALDVLHKNLGPVSQDLENEQNKIAASRFTQLMATALLPEKTVEQYEKKIGQIDTIQRDLDAWEQELLTIDSNVDALLELEAQLKQTAKAAQDLGHVFRMAGIADELMKLGFSYEEWVDLLAVLDDISASIAPIFADARKVKETTRRLLNETADFSHQVNQLWWQEVGAQFGKLIKDKDEARRQAQQSAMMKTKVHYGSLEGFEPLPAWNSDQLGTWYSYRIREGEILFQLNELTMGGGTGQREHDKRVELETELGAVRRKMLEMRSGVGAGTTAR